jgi:hypothetical protein
MRALLRWVAISTAATVAAVISLAVLLHAGTQGSNRFSDLEG